MGIARYLSRERCGRLSSGMEWGRVERTRARCDGIGPYQRHTTRRDEGLWNFRAGVLASEHVIATAIAKFRKALEQMVRTVVANYCGELRMAQAKASDHTKIDADAIAASGLSELGADFQVRRHPAARRLTLRVSRTRRAVIVTLPMQCDLVEAGQFLHRNLDWIRERLGTIPDAVPFSAGAVIPLRGEPHMLVFTGKRGSDGPVSREAAEGVGYARLMVGGMEQHAPRRLTDWLFAQAQRDLEQAVQHHAGNLGLRARRITVRDQASRWGSCSTTGTLSFSWRLILSPPLILDYVAAHEVAHLAEMNHGPRFWALVRRTMPKMDEAKQWLQIYGMDLHRYGPATASRR